MKNLLNLLERFSQSLNKDARTRETVTQIIKEKTGIELSKENINIKNGILEFTSSPVIKNEMALKENAIKDSLKERGVMISRVLYK